MGARWPDDDIAAKGFAVWSEIAEQRLLEQIDVGLMPLPDNAWTRGKCAFKAIRAMSFGATPIVSPVGASRDLVVPRENGLWAQNEAEWIANIELLARDRSLLRSLSVRAQETVSNNFSIEAWSPRLADLISSVC
jgi:glycosyltransferase involved in cell wall biosynthesis